MDFADNVLPEPNGALRVLETPELLESILSFLPPLELLVIQRVSQTWNCLIASSPRLQRLMFLRPDWSLKAKSFDSKRAVNKPGERPTTNLMLRRVLAGMYPTVTLKITNGEDMPGLGVESPGEGSELDASRKSQPEKGYWSWDVNIAYPSDRSLNVDDENASWRKMYICQPPCTSLHMVRRWQRSARPVMECETGITMALFVQEASKATDLWKTWTSSDRDLHFEGAIKCSSIEDSEAQFGTREVVYDEYVLERLMGIGYLASSGHMD